MSLTDALRHPWLDPSAESASDASQTSALARYSVGRSLSDVSELSELPEEDDHAGANDDASMIPAVPSSDDMLSVHALSINSPEIARIRRPLERRSKVLARELAAEAEAHPSPEAHSAEPSVGLYATTGGNVGLRALVAVDPLSMPRWVGRVQTRTRLGWIWIRSHRRPSAEGAVRARSSRPLRCLQPSRTITGMARGA